MPAIRDRIVKQARMKPEDLKANALNWRTHSPAQRAVLDGVLDEVGWVQGVILNRRTGNLVDGHLRVEQALERGEAKIPVTIIDVSEAEEAKILATFDPIGALAGTDGRTLKELLGVITSESDAVNKLLADITPSYGYADDESNPPDAPILKLDAGSIWQVGRHKLAVGSSADAELRAKLFDGQEIDGCCTDPPYDLSSDAVAAIVDAIAPRCVLLCGDRQHGALSQIWSHKLTFVWVRAKPRRLPTKNIPLLYHTLIGVFTRDDKTKSGWKRPRKDFGSVIREEQYATEEGFGHTKGVALFRDMLAGFDWATVCDPFAGAFTTVLACEELRKTCYAFELDGERAAMGLERVKAALGCDALRSA